jgi:hypothetical protein
MRWGVVFLLSLSMSVAGQQQQAAPAAQHQANFSAERQQADELYVSGKHQAALPLWRGHRDDL